MAKDTFWFKHDYNARNDEKILELRSVYGAEGYGVFWMLVESMAETENGGLKASLIGGLSLGYGVAKERLKEIVKYCLEIELLYEKDGLYFNGRLLKHKEDRKIFSESGKNGAKIRWKNRGAIRGVNAEERRGEEKREEYNKGVSFDLETNEVVFKDNTRQKLGKDQQAMLNEGMIKAKDITKGLIY